MTQNSYLFQCWPWRLCRMDVQQRIVKPQHDVVQELSRKKGCDKNVEFDLKIKIIPFL